MSEPQHPDPVREALRKLYNAADEVHDSRNNYPSDLGNRADERMRDEEFDTLGRVLAEVETLLADSPLEREPRLIHSSEATFERLGREGGIDGIILSAEQSKQLADHLARSDRPARVEQVGEGGPDA